MPLPGGVQEVEQDDPIPLHIQTFLWRQTSPFIRPKFGRQQDATAMEQREACKVFEKVLVQNIQYGLSVGLHDAIKATSRWRLIQASLPHVMHCCAALLYNRRNNNWDKLGASETKLLYTLHWVVLDAAEECADAEYEEGLKRAYDHYLLPIPTLEIFIYLFAPLTSYLKQSDFLTSFRLENGYKIWDPVFQHRHPDIPCFTAEAKPKRDILSAQRFEPKHNAKFGDVFLGGGSFDKESGPPGSAPCDPATKELKANTIAPATPPASARRGSKAGAEFLPAQPLEKLRATIKPLKNPAMATYMDVAVLRCLFISQWLEEGIDWALHFVQNRLVDIKTDSKKVEQVRPRSSSLPVIKQENYTDVKSRTTNYFDPDDLLQGDKSASLRELRRTSFGAISMPGDTAAGASSGKKKKKSKKSESKSPDDKMKRGRSVKDKSPMKAEWKKLRSALMFTSHEFLPPPPRPESSLGIGRPEDVVLQRGGDKVGKSDMIRGKSMPTLHILLDRRSSSSETPTKGEMHDESEDSSIVTKNLTVQVPVVPNPIITITEHSPVTSVQFFINPDNGDSPREESPLASGFPGVKSNLVRSHSDKNIAYYTDTTQEAPGSFHYITKTGKLSLLVVLKAVHSVSVRDNVTSLRVCEGLVNIIKLLLELNLLQSYNMGDSYFDELTKTKAPRSRLRDVEELNVHHLFVDSLIATKRHLGCPHGCSEGFHGPQADGLRKKISDLLLELFKANEDQFVKYFRSMITKRSLQEILDIFHAFVGFCAENQSMLSPSGHKKAGAPDSRTGYSHNFGAGFGKIGPKGVEGVIISHIFKPLISRMVGMHKELKLQENLSLYCDLRQFINYVKDNHGGTFRKVALSALIDSAIKFNLDNAVPAKASGSAAEGTSRSPFGEEGDRILSHRKSFFRKKGSIAGLKKAPSNSSLFEDFAEQWPMSANAPLGMATSHGSTPALLRINRSASPRLSITDDEALAMQKGRGSGGKFHLVNWLKGRQPEPGPHADHPSSDTPPLIPPESYPNTERLGRRSSAARSGKPPQKSSSHVSLTFMKGARRRMEDQFSKFGFGKSKSKQGSMEDNIDMSRRNSFEFENTFKEGDMLLVREARLVSLPLIRNGMMRFCFLMETCAPGSLPDPPLIAAMLDLKAPVAARAAFYFEVAHFVHSCNRGHWPSWMKLNIPLFRPSMPGKSVSATARGSISHGLHRSAGRMFYQWAEAIGARLEEMMLNDSNRAVSNLDDLKKRQLRNEDDEEDFLNEASVNANGNSCPFALKVAATQVLLEITAFLRETHQYLPSRSCRASISKPGDKGTAGYEPRTITANRRWSMALSSLGFSQTSAHSLVSLADPGGHPLPHPGERRISFVLHEADGEANSQHSSNTTLTHNEEHLNGSTEDGKKNVKRLSQSNVSTGGTVRPHLLRRATGAGASSGGQNGSFKRRSIKLKKVGDRRTKHRSSTVEESEDAPQNAGLGPNTIRRADSVRSRRRVSGISEKSDVSDRADASGDESPGVLSDDGQGPESPNDALQADDADIVKHLPWIKVVLGLINTLDFECTHHQFCQPNCYRRQIRSCSRLVKAIKKVYEYGQSDNGHEHSHRSSEDKEDAARKEKKLKKIVTGPSSPIRRKISVGHNMDRQIDRDAHYPTHSLHSSGTLVAHLDVEAGGHGAGDGRRGFSDATRAKKSPKEEKEDHPALKYIKCQIKGLFHNPISMLLKGTLTLQQNAFVELLVISWELLLEEDQHLAATSAVGFIISSVKCPEYAKELLDKELQHEDPSQRIKAITKFYFIWKSRYQCWPRMEEGAHAFFKVPPPSIEFTLPSPKIALDTMPVADPPWMPQVKAKVEEVTINQEQSVQRSFVTATKTRRKQQIEIVQRALQHEQEKTREEREFFRISAVPVTSQAAYEPALFHTPVEEHAGEDADDDAPNDGGKPAHHVQPAQAMFPSSLCAAAVTIINLLDDPQVGGQGSAVYEVAYKVIWNCLVEDTAVFLRHFFEKLTREKQKVIFQILRRLIRFMPRLPAQAAYTLYNYLIGFVMFYVRSPVEGSQELIGDTLSVLWLVVPSVHGLFLKDLKQVLRKEQCDATLLITANVPSAKKIIVHGPDVGGIPSQFPIHEDTQFYQLLVDSLDFFGIDDTLLNEYFLVDSKTNQMHNLNAFVRDFYFFKRSQYPQLSLIRMNPKEAFETLQKQAFTLQFLELGKALMSLSIVKSPVLAIQRVLFLHEELMKLPSFPRKALEANFGLYRGVMGKEMLGMDTLHKIVWVRLIARMFEVTSSFFANSADIHLFINVVNGALILHCEDAAVLRLCMATYINVAHQFKNIFALNGYMLIIPTILRIYSNHQTNGLLNRTIEFICKQFYIMHRKPFLLQMFGSAAPLLDTDVLSNFGDATKIQPKAFFCLLQSLGQYIVDPLDILELVDAEKPLKALDFCYQMDPETMTILDTISLCVTVVSYSADSMRSHQMLMILEAIVPLYMKHMQLLTMRKETPGGPRTELQTIHNISVCLKTLVSNCESLTRNFTGPQRAIDLRGSSMKNTKGVNSPPFEIDEDSHSKFMGESSYYTPRAKTYTGDEDNEAIRDDFRRPRDILLNLVAEFLTRSTARHADLSKKVPDLHQKGSQYELLDVKCHLRLAEVAHSLLKVAPYDPQTMGCRGLLRYMNEVLPTSEWRQEAMRPALIMILRRLDKMFNKIAKKNAIKRLTDWEAAKRLLKGVYLTFVKHPYIVHLPHLKSLIAICQNIILGDPNNPIGGDSSSALPSWAAALAQSPPTGFCSVAVRLVAMQMLQMGETQTLEVICGGGLTTPEKTEIYLMNMIYPMCIRISGGLKDVPKLRQCDITFTLGVILNSLAPPISKSSGKGGSDSTVLTPNPVLQSSHHQIGFLGLKIIIVCFERLLSNDWYRVARVIRELLAKNIGGVTLWGFLDFVVTHRTPLFILLLPLIRYKLLRRVCENETEYAFQQQIKEKLSGKKLSGSRSKGQMLVSLLQELKCLKDDLVNKKSGTEENKYKLVPDGHTAAHRLSFAITSAFQSSSKTVTVGPIASPQQTSTPGDPSSPMETTHPQMARGWSFKDKPVLPLRGLSVKVPGRGDGNRKVVERFLRRTSYPYNVEESSTEGTAEGESGEKTSKPLVQSEPKLFRRSTLHILRKKGSKRGSATNVSVSSPPGSSEAITETAPQLEEVPEPEGGDRKNSSDAGSGSDENTEERNKHRLMRQKAQSRKTFRFRKSRRGAGFKGQEGDHTDGEEETGLVKQCSLPEEDGYASSIERPGSKASGQSIRVEQQGMELTEVLDAFDKIDENSKLLGEDGADNEDKKQESSQ